MRLKREGNPGAGHGGSNPGATGNPGAGRGGGNNPNNNPNNPYSNNPSLNPNLCNGPMAFQYPSCGTRVGIIPTMPDTVATNQQVLYALASGTGGFTIFNTNDLLQGLGKVAKEMNEYYVLGYAPANQAHDGSFHKIKVKVERSWWPK